MLRQRAEHVQQACVGATKLRELREALPHGGVGVRERKRRHPCRHRINLLIRSAFIHVDAVQL
jgi:hypothetical protein